MKIFFDTEFIEDGKTIDLISIGLVREDGAELYLESSECELSRADTWVREHVISKLDLRAPVDREQMVQSLIEFAGEKPEFWAYYAAYDWVALCQLFGKMIDLPLGWPMYCRDLKQLQADRFPDVSFPQQDPATEHHALSDARWLRNSYLWLLQQKS